MTTQFYQRVAKLVPYPSKHSTVPALAFAYHFEPPIEQKAQAGSLYVVIEVMAKESLASQVVDLVIKTMGEEYYNKKFQDEPNIRFEKSIAALNTQLAKLYSSHHGKHINNLSAVIAVIDQDQLYLSQTGKAHARLYRSGKATELSEGLSTVSNPQKTFHGIAEGSLKQKDKLVFTSPAILFEFQAKQLDQMIVDNSPASAVQKMSHQLEGQDSSARCAALIVELTDLNQAADEPLDAHPDTAMVGKPQTKLDEVKAATTPIAAKASQKALTAVTKSRTWWHTQALPVAKHHTKSIWNRLWVKYINPNPRKALALVGGMVILLGVSIYAFSVNHVNYRGLVVDYKEVIALTETAEAKQNLGEAQASQQTLASAKAKLENITKTYTPKQVSKAISTDKDLATQQNIAPAKLRTRQITLDDKLNNITRLTFNNVVDFTSKKNFQASFLVRLDDRLYCVDTSSGSLYQVDTSKNSATVVAQNSALKSAVAATPSSLGDSIYLLTSIPNVLQYSPGKTLFTVKLSGGDWTAGNAIASYIGNLYILSPQNSQIYRHSRTSIGFSASSSYIKRTNTVSVSKGQGLAINGTILVANGSSKITTFSNGLGAEESVAKLPSSVQGFKRIQLQSDQALLTLDTDGLHLYSITSSADSYAFRQQYVSPSNTRVEDFVVTSDGTLYVLSGKKILVSKLP